VTPSGKFENTAHESMGGDKGVGFDFVPIYMRVWSLMPTTGTVFRVALNWLRYGFCYSTT